MGDCHRELPSGSVTVTCVPCRHGADAWSLSQLSPGVHGGPHTAGSSPLHQCTAKKQQRPPRPDTHGGLTATCTRPVSVVLVTDMRSVSATTLFSIPTVLSGLKSASDCSLQRVLPTTPKQTAWGGTCRTGSIGNGGRGQARTNTALCANEQSGAVAAWPSVCPPDHHGPALSVILERRAELVGLGKRQRSHPTAITMTLM